MRDWRNKPRLLDENPSPQQVHCVLIPDIYSVVCLHCNNAQHCKGYVEKIDLYCATIWRWGETCTEMDFNPVNARSRRPPCPLPKPPLPAPEAPRGSVFPCPPGGDSRGRVQRDWRPARSAHQNVSRPVPSANRHWSALRAAACSALNT